MKMRTPFRIMLAAMALAMPFLSGCNDGGPSSKMFMKNSNGKRLRVAVLPFDNVSKDEDAGRVVTNTVVTYLLSTGDFDVVEPGIVYSAMGAENIRQSDGLTAEACQKLQPRLNADAFVMGMVEEYGEVRIGPDTYPSISFSARLVNAHTADILWAATISKTGADNVKVFDIGRVSSLGKLSKRAVSALAASLARNKAALTTGTAMPGIEVASAGTNGGNGNNGDHGGGFAPSAPIIPTSATTTSTVPSVPGSDTTAAPASDPAAGSKAMDESATYGEKELTALLKDLNGAKASDITYSKHYHDQVEAKYRIGDTGRFVEVKLVDYRKPETSEKFLQGYNPGAQPSTFEALPSFAGETGFGYHHLDIAVGRFGLFLRGPKDNTAEVEAVGKGLIGLLK